MRTAAIVTALALALALAVVLCVGVAAHAHGGGRTGHGHSHDHEVGAHRAMTRAAKMMAASGGGGRRARGSARVPVAQRVSRFHTVSLRTPAAADADDGQRAKSTAEPVPFIGAATQPYPAALQFEFTLDDGRQYRVKVEQNMALTAPTYTEQSVGAFGTVTTVRRGALTRDDNCYYQGHALRIDASAGASAGAGATARLPYVALDICGGAGAVYGSLYLDDGRWYAIEPADQEDVASASASARAQQHVVYATDDQIGAAADVHEFCGAHSHADAHRHARYTSTSTSTSSTSTSTTESNDNAADHATNVPFPAAEEYQNVDVLQAQQQQDDHQQQQVDVHTQGIVLPNTTASGQVRYVELFLVNDYARYQQMVDSTEGDTLAIANRAAVLYAQNTALSPPINIVLVGQLTWQSGDPYAAQLCVGTCGGTAFPCSACGDDEVGVSQLLSLWNAWRANPSHDGVPYHDAGFLLSGRDFEGALVGYAGIGVMCDFTQSGGIVQTYRWTVAFAGFTLTHELGHTLGMIHDMYTTCSPAGSIMTTTVSTTGGSLPQFFSACSRVSFRDYFGNMTQLQAAAYSDVTSGRVTCLDNRPANAYVLLPSQAVCGNGYIEAGETCDCGASDCMTLVGGSPADRCCNGTTCQLKPTAQCSANSACCDAVTCMPVSAPTPAAASGTICRYADVRSGCDTNQVCDGVNVTCPAKAFKPAGSACVNRVYNAEGYCDALDHCSQLGGRVERRWQPVLPTATTTIVAVGVAVLAVLAVAARRHEHAA